MQDEGPTNGEKPPFHNSAELLRLIIGKTDPITLAEKANIDPKKMTAALKGREGLSTEEINRITSGARAHQLVVTTGNERKHSRGHT